MSTARTRRPSAACGMGRPANTCRSRGTSTLPLFSTSYMAPCPRRCSATSVKSTGALTDPSAHSNASTNSNSSSPRVVRQSNRSSVKRDAFANVSPRPGSGGRLTLTAFVSIGAPWSEHMIRRRPPQRPVNAQLWDQVRWPFEPRDGVGLAGCIRGPQLMPGRRLGRNHPRADQGGCRSSVLVAPVPTPSRGLYAVALTSRPDHKEQAKGRTWLEGPG